MRRAKIVCTLGPATRSVEALEALVEAGLDCARLNFSHGNHEDHAEVALRLREVAQRARRPISILADLSGPKMRVGRFGAGPIVLEEGDPFVLTTRDVDGDRGQVSVTYPALPRDVQLADAILLDDGLLRLRVVRVDGPDVYTVVEVGGPLSNNKGLNLPGVALSTPALTEKDRLDVAFAVDQIGVDYVALSFVRKPEDIEEAQALSKGVPVIAKIEKPEAVANLDAILDITDGVMVARGDLGVEMGPEMVPMIQKRIIREANRRGKVVITATQMLDSMIRNPRPTRAEAADVANAVLDGTDALMLSGETATGKYAVETVRMMNAIVCEAESSQRGELTESPANPQGEWDFATAGARAATVLSFTADIKAIVTLSRDGRTARLLSEYRPKAPILAITPSQEAANRLALRWGVVPRVDLPAEDLEETLRIATSALARAGMCQKGDAFVLVIGWPPSSGTNTVKLHRL